MTGKFIVIYGPNNLGKSEQIARLSRGLQEVLIDDVVSVKYPIYDLPTGQRINRELRGQRTMTDLDLQREFAANRRTFEPDLKAMLGSGTWVIAEDYKHTGIAWGIVNGIPREQMEEINNGLLDPDLTILLDGERYTSGIERGHRYEDGGNWNEARRVHLELANDLGWEIVNANQLPECVAEDIWDIVSKSLL